MPDSFPTPNPKAMNAHLETPLFAQCLTLSNSANGVTDGVITAADVALACDPYVGHCEMQVHGSQALLLGHVSTHLEREQAGDMTAGVSGVVDVNNRLKVSGVAEEEGFTFFFPDENKLSPAVPGPDHALAERIRTRYCWSASLHDQEVDVQVEDGRATLTGTVDTWLDHKHEALAAHEAGTREVNYHLLVLTTSPIHNEQLAAAEAHRSFG